MAAAEPTPFLDPVHPPHHCPVCQTLAHVAALFCPPPSWFLHVAANPPIRTGRLTTASVTVQLREIQKSINGKSEECNFTCCLIELLQVPFR